MKISRIKIYIFYLISLVLMDVGIWVLFGTNICKNYHINNNTIEFYGNVNDNSEWYVTYEGVTKHGEVGKFKIVHELCGCGAHYNDVLYVYKNGKYRDTGNASQRFINKLKHGVGHIEGDVFYGWWMLLIVPGIGLFVLCIIYAINMGGNYDYCRDRCDSLNCPIKKLKQDAVLNKVARFFGYEGVK